MISLKLTIFCLFVISFFKFASILFVVLENGELDPILKQTLLDDRFYNNHSFQVWQRLICLICIYIFFRMRKYQSSFVAYCLESNRKIRQSTVPSSTRRPQPYRPSSGDTRSARNSKVGV